MFGDGYFVGYCYRSVSRVCWCDCVVVMSLVSCVIESMIPVMVIDFFFFFFSLFVPLDTRLISSLILLVFPLLSLVVLA